MKHTCPHCGEKSFTPLQKARCGGLSSSGKPCLKCGLRCVNGIPSLVVNTVLRLAALVMIFYTYFTFTELSEVFWFGLLPLILAFLLGFLFDMFFGKLVPALKKG